MNFLELVKARYSVRNYEERPIEQNKLDYIMECVRLAPSAVNFQPWKFAVITEKKLLEALKSAYPREWIKTAPCIIVACGDHNVAWHRKLDNKDHTDVGCFYCSRTFVSGCSRTRIGNMLGMQF